MVVNISLLIMIFSVHFATYFLKNKSGKYVLIFNAIFSREHVYSFFILISVLISMVEYIDLTFPTEYAYYKYIYAVGFHLLHSVQDFTDYGIRDFWFTTFLPQHFFIGFLF